MAALLYFTEFHWTGINTFLTEIGNVTSNTRKYKQDIQVVSLETELGYRPAKDAFPSLFISLFMLPIR